MSSPPTPTNTSGEEDGNKTNRSSGEMDTSFMECENVRLRQVVDRLSGKEKFNTNVVLSPSRRRPPSVIEMDSDKGSDASGLDHTEAGLGKLTRIDVHPEFNQSRMNLPLMALRALGVIYGDIGTSPLYTVSSILTTVPTEAETLGAISLCIWSLIIVVSLKYVILILRADHHGEGGIFCLCSQLLGVQDLPNRWKNVAITLAVFGSAFVIGDGVITPAISVLSALEGLEIEINNFEQYVMPIAIVILFLLFVVQYKGTSRIGISFGPIMLVWFISLAMLGIYNIAKQPSILRAFSPHYGIAYLVSEQTNGFFLLGAVVLCTTGAEALYADLGHFGSLPVRVSWFAVTLPCLLLNYIGQGAALLIDPTINSSVFFSSMPPSVVWPMIILATFATIIASQAMITGSFSLIHQAMNFGYFPRVNVRHTSKHLAGQIYIPEINYVLMVLCLAAVAGFQHSVNLAAAYGVSVTAVMTFTSVLFMLVCHYVWNVRWYWITLYGCTIFVIDLFFFTSNLVKIPDGGWFTLVIGIIFAIVMFLWKEGKDAVHNNIPVVPIEQCEKLINKYAISRPFGVAVFMNRSSVHAPISFVKLLSRQKTMPNIVVFITINMVESPFVLSMARFQVTNLGEGLIGVVGNYGYMEVPDAVEIVAEILRTYTPPPRNEVKAKEYDSRPTITFYLSQEKIEVDKERWLYHRIWVKLFKILNKNARNASSMFKIPPEDTIEVGCKVIV